jgi:hypothetical protein
VAGNTAPAIASQSYWPYLKEFIELRVWACNSYHHVKHSNELPYDVLQPVSILETQDWMVNIDLSTKLTYMARDSYDCIIMIVNLLTVRVWGKAARDKNITAAVCAREFNNMWVRNRGSPDDIFSDWDICNMSDSWATLIAWLDIICCHSYSYHLAIDVHAGNWNGLIELNLKAYMPQYRKMWDCQLAFTEFIYNVVYHIFTRLLWLSLIRDLSKGCWLVCWYGLRVPSGSWKSVWK